MCTSPQVITRLPLLCRTPACISTHLKRASLNVHECLMYYLTQTFNFPTPIRCPSTHSCQCVHDLELHKHPIWAQAHISRLLLQAPGVAVSLRAPVHLVWPLSIRAYDQLMAPTPGGELLTACSGQKHPSRNMGVPFLQK